MPAETHSSPQGSNPNPVPPNPSLAPAMAPPIISRRRVGIIALICLAISGVLKLGGPEHAGLMSALFRVGTVMAALWLALPPKGQPVLWRNFTPVLVIALAFTLLAKNPKVLIIAIPVGFIVLFLLSFRPSRKLRR